MLGFLHRNGDLVCDGVPVTAIAESEGTPLYIYSAQMIRRAYHEIDAAFHGYPHAIHYALKANSTLGIVRLLRAEGCSADANSIWEIEIARRAGFPPEEIVFTGVGKSAMELEKAVPLGLKSINVESAGEFGRIEDIARRTGRPCRVALRINPDIDALSHPHISTGLKVNKFGMPVETALGLIKSNGSHGAVSIVALHVHVGSQITTLPPLRGAARFLAQMAQECRARDVTLEYLDVGGGLGIAYDGAHAISPAEYVAALLEEIAPTSLPVIAELGRAIVGPASVLVARVVDVKPRNGISDFAVIDAGMTELMRPALYGAFHRIEPVRPRAGPVRQYEIVGPVCESSDVVGRDRDLHRLEVGDLVAIRDAGAYGSAMASNYNRRPLPAEVMVDEGHWTVIRRRQVIDDLVALEV